VDLEIGALRILRERVAHPLLGTAHVIAFRGAPITAMSELDWDRPTRIPTVANPGALPPGTGALLLNAIAERAIAAGVPALRYAGPYPTPALFRALGRSFRTTADEATFTADLLARAARVAMDELPIDFVPAPHRRVDHACGFCELRDDRLERAVIDGTPFEPHGSPGRLVKNFAEIWFGDAVYARIAELATTGELIAGPHAPPAIVSSVVGTAFPRELRAAIGELVADVVPAPLATRARELLVDQTIHWADLGTRAARRTDSGFAVHAALWERIAPLGLARLGLALSEALAPVVTHAIVAELARASFRP
jgi:hypothetical protein